MEPESQSANHFLHEVGPVRLPSRVWKSPTCRQEALQALDSLEAQGLGPEFTLAEIIAEMRRIGSQYPEGFSGSGKSWVDVTNRPQPYPEVVRSPREAGAVGWMAPPAVNDRVVVQRSRMLVAPTGRTSALKAAATVELPSLPSDWGADLLEKLFSAEGPGRRAIPSVLALRIPRDLKAYIAGVLSTSYGINQQSLSPDVSGFSLGRN